MDNMGKVWVSNPKNVTPIRPSAARKTAFAVEESKRRANPLLVEAAAWVFVAAVWGAFFAWWKL